MSTLGDFCGSTLGDFVGSALGDRGCERKPENCYGCSFLPHTFSVELSGILGFLVWYEDGEPIDSFNGYPVAPFDLSICNGIYSVYLPAWSEPRCSSVGWSTYRGPLLWFYNGLRNVYVKYRLQLEYLATDDGNQITAELTIWVTPYYSHYIEWSIVLPWTEDDCCDGIGRNLPKVSAGPIGPCGGPGWYCLALLPGTGDGSICTITS